MSSSARTGLCELFHKIGPACAQSPRRRHPWRQLLHASSPAESDSYLALGVDDDRDRAAAFAEAQHLLEFRRILFHVHVLEGDPAVRVIVARRLRVWAAVFPVDDDHRFNPSAAFMIAHRRNPSAELSGVTSTVQCAAAVNTPTLTQDTFTEAETRALTPFFSNTDRPVFALTNLPETVKGALFARYSRSAKSLRRLFLDEFLGEIDAAAHTSGNAVGVARADKLYARVLSEYGDDSVAQLGGAHIACEGVSNVLTKVLEWGRLMAYLEQSTRYVPYTDRPNGRWKYYVPPELAGTPLQDRYEATLDRTFEIYSRWFQPMQEHFRARFPKDPADSDGVYRAVIRAKALDTLRGLLPA